MSTHSRETSSESHDRSIESQPAKGAESADRDSATNDVQAAYSEPTHKEWEKMLPLNRAENALGEYEKAGQLDDAAVRYNLTEAAWTEFKLSDSSDGGRYVNNVSVLLAILERTGQDLEGLP
jgi:hypothetical protein